MRAALQGHESRHGRADAELARFIVARGQHSAPVARAAHADRFSFQGRLIANFDRSVKAIHVEMDDRARLFVGLHKGNVSQGMTVSKSPLLEKTPQRLDLS